MFIKHLQTCGRKLSCQISSNLYSVDKNSLYPQPAITENNNLNSKSVMPDV